ncbi:MAG: amidohydrolase family protein [Gillisia sp.]
MKLILHTIINVFILILFCNCTHEEQYDLIIENSNLLNVNTGQILKNRSILIKNGIIEKIVGSSKEYKAVKKIDAKGKLVTPSFIDTHTHPMSVFGDNDEAPKYLKNDSINYFRKELTDTYLPYGVTTILMLGHPETWLPPILKWQKEKSPQHTDIYTSGAALISDEQDEPYIGHIELKSPEEAREKVIAYYNSGIRTIKIYFNLRKPEFIEVMKTADSLNMNVFGHIGDYSPNRISIQEALGFGLKNFEHIPTLPFSVLKGDDWEKVLHEFMVFYGKPDTKEKTMMIPLELFRYIDKYRKDNMISLIDKLSKAHASVSTSIGIIYRNAVSMNNLKANSKVFTSEQIQRNEENFTIMMKYIKLMLSKNITLRIGTDTEDGGKIFLFEMYLLSEHGISMEDIFKIATINGAKIMRINKEVGSMEIGKSANLIIWDKNPFLKSMYLFDSKTVIKNGNVYIN